MLPLFLHAKMDREEERKHQDYALRHLQSQCGNAAVALLVCEGCDDPAGKCSAYMKYPWAMKLTCRRCDTYWIVCVECGEMRKRLTTQTMISRHRARHSTLKKRKLANITGLHGDEDGLDQEEGEESGQQGNGTAENQLNQVITDLSGLDFQFEREASRNFFEREVNGRGTEALVSLATKQEFDPNNNMDSEEQAMHIQLANLVSRISRGDREALAGVLEKVGTCMKKSLLQSGRSSVHSGQLSMDPTVYGQSRMQCGSSQHSARHTPIPTTPQMIRSIYVKGKYALLPNLPHPDVRNVMNHAYVSLTECIRDFLANGYDTECFEATKPPDGTVSRLADSEVLQAMYKKALSLHGDATEDLVVLAVTKWSDDFDANNSKDNRFSVWVKTTTILAPHGLTKSPKYTYPIALGLKGENHDDVENLYAEDLLALQKLPLCLFYHGGKKKMVRVFVQLVASLQVSDSDIVHMGDETIYMGSVKIYMVSLIFNIVSILLLPWCLYFVSNNLYFIHLITGPTRETRCQLHPPW